jgi:DmsE family decaheme c-type cytochrome
VDSGSLLVLLALFLLTSCVETAPKPAAAPPVGSPAAYIGAEICKACHEDRYNSYATSIHAKGTIGGTPATANACESCHGPGAEHASTGGGKGVGGLVGFDKKGDARVQSAQCLACHEAARPTVFWDLGAHRRNVVACSACHAIHTVATTKLKAPEPDVCFACHRDIRSQFNKQSHHPVPEGLLRCSNCHEAHGGFGRKLIKADAVNELCYGCHAEKRGPFVWEHPPAAENCLTCHQPHGSNHLSLLDRKVPQLCQSCHDSIGGGHHTEAYTRFHAFGGAAKADKNKFFARSCLNCHTNIHGSNGPGDAGQHFIR